MTPHGMKPSSSTRTVSASCLLALSLTAIGCHAEADAPTTTAAPSTATAAVAPAATRRDVSATAISSAAARHEFAVERSLGADCPTPGKDNRDYGPNNYLIEGMCRGRLPVHMARALAQMSPAQLGLSAEAHRDLLDDDGISLRAVPGLGQRSDFWARVGHGWIRSFEGPDADTTVYLIQGRSCEQDTTTPPRDCPMGLRAYRTQGDAAPREVTDEVLPPDPVLSEAQRAFYYDEYRGPSDPLLLTEKLYYAPTLRWVMEFDSHDTLPANTPNRLNGHMVHLGFLQWTGTRFELRPTAARAQWPCYPVAQGEPACHRDEAAPDPYVTPDQ